MSTGTLELKTARKRRSLGQELGYFCNLKSCHQTEDERKTWLLSPKDGEIISITGLSNIRQNASKFEAGSYYIFRGYSITAITYLLLRGYQSNTPITFPFTQKTTSFSLRLPLCHRDPTPLHWPWKWGIPHAWRTISRKAMSKNRKLRLPMIGISSFGTRQGARIFLPIHSAYLLVWI